MVVVLLLLTRQSSDRERRIGAPRRCRGVAVAGSGGSPAPRRVVPGWSRLRNRLTRRTRGERRSLVAQLLQEAEVVAHGPVLDDEPAVDPEDVEL